MNEYNALESQAKLYAAIAKAQGEFPDIPKSKTVRIAKKTGGTYEFQYAELATILKLVRPALAKNNLALVQTLEGEAEGTSLVTLLLHGDGGRIESHVLLPRPSDGDPKAFGAIVTYYRRYAVSAILGVVSDDDADEDGTGAPETVGEKPGTAKSPALAEAEAVAAKGVTAYRAWYAALKPEARRPLVAHNTALKKIAEEADAKAKTETVEATTEE